jgi:hypothetical protein
VRVTREKLVQLARKEVERRAAADGGLLSGYLIGSVASGEPLLGEAGDIDLVLIHQGEPAAEREVVALSDEIHFDIYHHPQRFYAQPPQLRVHPWLGPALCEPVFLYDPTHFFERAQAGARGQFHRPDHVRSRAGAFLENARRLHAALATSDHWMADYLAAVLDAANAAGTLAGFPAAGRRVALALKALAAELDHPEVYGGFLRLLGAESLGLAEVGHWLTCLARAYDVVSADDPGPLLAPARRAYYLAGFQALIDGDQPQAVTWPLLHVWECCLRSLGGIPAALAHEAEWRAARDQLGLAPGDQAPRRDQLETYMDHVEAVIEEWAERHGA